MKYIQKNGILKETRVSRVKRKINTLKWVLGAIERDIALLSPTQFVARKSPEYNKLLERRTVLDWDIQKERQILKDIFNPTTNQGSALISFVAKTKVA